MGRWDGVVTILSIPDIYTIIKGALHPLHSSHNSIPFIERGVARGLVASVGIIIGWKAASCKIGLISLRKVIIRAFAACVRLSFIPPLLSQIQDGQWDLRGRGRKEQQLLTLTIWFLTNWLDRSPIIQFSSYSEHTSPSHNSNYENAHII